uniref:Uncharacterized protein n=1 Tax=Anguilla anguilla TaxID=7936 RepID=A0A0E9WCM1_ANGAN
MLFWIHMRRKHKDTLNNFWLNPILLHRSSSRNIYSRAFSLSNKQQKYKGRSACVSAHKK